jgi:cysteine desulfurase
MKKEIYLDYGATTYVDPLVKKEMDKYFTKEFGNPSSMHSYGLKAKYALENSRKTVAEILGCKPSEIIFTSGGTASINLALKGFVKANKDKGKHIITSATEHHAVLDTVKYLEKEGFEITILDVDKYGRVRAEDLKKAIKEDTILVSIIYANNEIGTINDVKAFSKICKDANVVFHIDACQAGAYLELNVNELSVDMMTLNGSKIYGPKGVGVLYVKDGLKLEPLLHGGGQEKGLFSGTHNVANIAGFAKALELARRMKDKESARLSILRNKLIKGVQDTIPKSFLNGHPIERLPNNVNMTIMDIEGESMLLYLDKEGVCASTGSACTSKKLEPSHVILALGLPHEASHGTIRFTLGRDTEEKDIDYVLEIFPGIVEKLRKLSPIKLEL